MLFRRLVSRISSSRRMMSVTKPPTFYNLAPCPSCRSVLMAADHLGIQLDIVEVDFLNKEHKSAEFTKINPLQTVPALDDNGFLLAESRAILGYLVEKFRPNHTMYPQEPRLRAEVDRMLYFDIGTLYRYLSDLWIPQIFKGLLADTEKEKLTRSKLEMFENILGNTKYAAGNNVTIADFSILSTVTFAEVMINYNFTNFPNVCNWMHKMKQGIELYEAKYEAPLKQYLSFIEQKHEKSKY